MINGWVIIRRRRCCESELSLSTSRLNYSQERHNGKVDFARQRDRLKIVSQGFPKLIWTKIKLLTFDTRILISNYAFTHLAFNLISFYSKNILYSEQISTALQKGHS